MTLFGQAALTARRLVEAGGRFVSVFWDEYGLAGTGWDTHWDHYPRMKDELLPGLDRTLSGLLLDLDRRGLLDETLVVVPQRARPDPADQRRPGRAVATTGRAATRSCWPAAASPAGSVIGRSDKIASDPVERPVSPKDVLATIYHLLGIDPATTLTDRQGRPLPLVPGRPRSSPRPSPDRRIPRRKGAAVPPEPYIDAHSHIWTPDVDPLPARRGLHGRRHAAPVVHRRGAAGDTAGPSGSAGST